MRASSVPTALWHEGQVQQHAETHSLSGVSLRWPQLMKAAMEAFHFFGRAYQ